VDSLILRGRSPRLKGTDMTRTALIERAARLEDQSARAAYAGAVAAHAGCTADAEAWERRAERLETLARDSRRAALAN
jgi:transcription elongation GreA/GreB family factor